MSFVACGISRKKKKVRRFKECRLMGKSQFFFFQPLCGFAQI